MAAMGWEEAVVAATKHNAAQALAMAALALPVAPLPVVAGQMEAAQAGVKYLYYSEDQRMTASSPLMWVDAPVGENFDVSAAVTLDSVSGASPQYVSNQSGKPVHALSSASIRDERRAADLRVTRHFEEGSLALGASVSSEHDYLSQGVSADLRLDFNEKNTTLALGVGETNDRIGATTKPALDEGRRTRDFLVGVTQLLTPVSLVQSNLSYSDGSGYFDDPYKFTISFLSGVRAPVVHNDSRPNTRRAVSWLTRYRHYLPAWETALGAEYRYYRSSWGIVAHTLEVNATRDFGNGLKVTPSLRYYSQSAADFYLPVNASRSGIGSGDSRLGAFGAYTAALKVQKTFAERTTFDATVALYRQQAAYRLDGEGSPDFPGLTARILMLGVSRVF